MQKKENHKKALSVQKGIPQPPKVNPVRGSKKDFDTQALFDGIRAGNRAALGKAITFVESTHPAHREKANRLIEQCLPFSGKSFRLGISGVPGVGKSSFIEAFGLHLLSQGHKVAVLAVDPSSRKSGGSILGDKTRMEKLSTDDRAFVRPSPSAGSLGGVAQKTRETIFLCEAAGYDYIIVETVGVGQSETAVQSMVDFFLLLMLSGAGDELQGIKRGIMEMADMIAINKADGKNIIPAETARHTYEKALALFPKKDSGWQPPVQTCSALTGKGIDMIAGTIDRYKQMVIRSGFFEANRKQQARYWLEETIWENLKNDFMNHPAVAAKYEKMKQSVTDLAMSPFTAAAELIKLYKKDS